MAITFHPGLELQTPPIRDFFSLEELLSPDALKYYAQAADPWVSFLDSKFQVIPIGEVDLELCAGVSKAILGEQACENCPVKAELCDANGSVQKHCTSVQKYCTAGVLKTIAPVVVNGCVIGYVSGPQIPNLAFYRDFLDKLPQTDANTLRARRDQLDGLDPAKVRETVERVARRLSRRALFERRLKILRDSRHRIVAAIEPDDVLDNACRTLEALFGLVDINFYLLVEDGSLRLYRGRGPHENYFPARMKPGQGHVGWVIKHGRALYEGDLAHDRHDFVQVFDPPARSAFTVPMAWGEDEICGALQVQSPTLNAFSEADRQSMQAVADYAGLAAVKLFLQRQRRANASKHLASGSWTAVLLEVTAETAHSAIHVLAAKRRLYLGLAEEAMRISGAPATGVRIFDPGANVLRFAACAGEPWTLTGKNMVYKVGEDSAGMHAFETKQLFYLRDVKKEADPRFVRIFEHTKSLLVLPFRLQGKMIGVLSVDWDLVDGCTVKIREDLLHLLTQFENILAVLDTREKGLVREVEEALSGGTDVEQVAKESVDQICSIFGARGCSLFLRVHGSGNVALAATTGGKPNPLPVYQPGEGLTGWIALHQRPVRVTDTGDSGQLKSIAPDLQHLQVWSEDIRYDDAIGKQSFLGVPMVAEGELVGVLRLTTKADLTEFTNEEETLLQQIADRLAVALQSAWSLAATASRIQVLEREAGVQRSIAEATSLEAVCRVLAQEYMRSQYATGAYFHIHDESDQVKLDIGEGLLGDLTTDPTAWSSFRRGMQSPLFWEDIKPDPATYPEWVPILNAIQVRFPHSPHITVRSAAYVPFSLPGVPISVAVLLSWSGKQSFNQKRQQELTALARRAFLAMRLFLLQRRTQIELDKELLYQEGLRSLGLGFARAHNLDELMKNVLLAASNESQLERGTIRLFDEHRSALVLQHPEHSIGFPAGALIREKEIDEFVERSLGQRRPTFVPDANRDEPWLQFLRRIDSLPATAEAPNRLENLSSIRTVLDVPIWLQEKCIGLIHLDSTQVRHVPDQAQSHLEILAMYAAVAIDTERLRSELERRILVVEPLAMGGTMLSGFLHVMRNRINDLFMILGNITDPRFSPDRIQEKAATMLTELRRLRSICDDLQRSAKADPISSGEEVPLDTLVSRCLGDFAARYRKKVDFEQDYFDPSPTVTGNPIQLEIAFKMIIQNAIEAMENGGKLTVRTWIQDGVPTVSFSDNGTGMEPPVRDRCLDRAFTTKSERGGTGLGLAVVNSVVTRHGGTVHVASELGKGSTFTISFRSGGSLGHAQHSRGR